MQTLELVAVLDFEATCADPKIDRDWDRAQQEIIELPVALVSIAERRVVDTFSTFVRPTRQPHLTDFCTALTSIAQRDVDGAEPIDVVMARLEMWLETHGATATNTLTATCGDWDLRRMWPLQVSLVPGLRTPVIFQSWCNLKVAFATHTGVKPTGMMSMLEHLGLTHQGTHHRGIDDVMNLCALTLRLLERGAEIGPTWSTTARDDERALYENKVRAALARLEEKTRARARLPASVPDDVRRDLDAGIARANADVERLRTYVRVFSPA